MACNQMETIKSDWPETYLGLSDSLSSVPRLDTMFTATPVRSPATITNGVSEHYAASSFTDELSEISSSEILASENKLNVSNDQGHVRHCVTDSCFEQLISNDVTAKSQKDRKERRKQDPRKLVPALQFPPCLICGGKSSGYHFGVTTCEACKAFFRRYLLRNDVAACRKDGKCKLNNRSRGNCSDCRLKRCLEVGMAKEKSKLGRYSVSKRTETIQLMNKLTGKQDTGICDDVKGDDVTECTVTGVTVEEVDPSPSTSYDPDSEIIGRTLKINTDIEELDDTVSDKCIDSLISAMDNVFPFGRNIKTDDDVRAAHKFYHDKHLLNLKIFGERKPVSKQEHEIFYRKYGIDLDGRYDVMRACHNEIEALMERYCNFAKNIPGFVKLTYHDQANLLKAYRCDFFTIIGCHGYNEEYNILLYNGSGFHLGEVSGTIFSLVLSDKLTESYLCLQRLRLSKREQAIVLGLVLTSQDRGRLDNRKDVETIQDSLTELLWKELQQMYGDDSCRRYSRIIEALSKLREFTDQHTQEYQEICKDETYLEEAPLLSEFLLEY